MLLYYASARSLLKSNSSFHSAIRIGGFFSVFFFVALCLRSFPINTHTHTSEVYRDE